MRLTPLGFKVISIAPLVPAAILIWVTTGLPVFNGLSILLLFGAAAMVVLAIHNWGWYRIEYPRYTPRRGAGRSMQGAYHVARHGA